MIEPKRCEVCGCQLNHKYRPTGRCAKHQPVKRNWKAELTKDEVAAKRRGMSYGQYMAAKKEGLV